MNKESKEVRNLERINDKKILNFGDLSINQKTRGISVSWNEAWIKCERCNERIKAEWKNGGWNIGNWKTYLKKSQIKKHEIGYYIVGGIQFYCPDCDVWHNYKE